MREHGKLVTFDPNLRKMLWPDLTCAKEEMLWGLHQADVVKLSKEAPEFGEDSWEVGARRILNEYSVKLAFLTLGASGCLYANTTAMGRVPALPGISPVDTTGAGVIFGGSALYNPARRHLQHARARGHLDGALYYMDIHGLAPYQHFDVVEKKSPPSVWYLN